MLIFACLQVKYNERFVEELHLPVEKIAFGSAKPQPFAAETIAASSWPPVARPVLQQEPQATASQDTFQVMIPTVSRCFDFGLTATLHQGTYPSCFACIPDGHVCPSWGTC